MYILGINPGSHESSTCLLENGKIIAMAEEERFTRRKHAIDQMPYYATQYCLHMGGIEFSDLDYIATCWNSPDMIEEENIVHFSTPQELEKRIGFWREIFPTTHFGTGKIPKVVYVSHHLAHTASVYRTSPCNEGVALIVDGQGNTISTTIAHCTNQEIHIGTQYAINQSLGFFYQAVTSYLGFGWLGSEGKTMGLAPYGEPIYDFPEIRITWLSSSGPPRPLGITRFMTCLRSGKKSWRSAKALPGGQTIGTILTGDAPTSS